MPREVVGAIIRFSDENWRPNFVFLMRAHKIDDGASFELVVMARMAIVIAKEEDAVVKKQVLVEETSIEISATVLKFLLTRPCKKNS